MAEATAWTVGEAAQGAGGRVAAGGADVRVSGVSIDTRTLQPGQLFVAVKGPRFDGHDFLKDADAKGAAAVMVHRDVETRLPVVRVDDTTRALGHFARHVRGKSKVPVVCITGSAGKTTTKEMTAALLGTRGPVLKTEGNLNNQYGLPLMLLRLSPEHTAAVLELGMSAAGELRDLTNIARPDVAVITLVAPVHLEFFESVDAIAAAKAEILEGLGPDGVAVLNWDDPRVRKIGEARKGRVVWFGRDRACHVSAENWRGTVHGMRFDLRIGGKTADVALPLPGTHFVSNFLAAAAVADHLGVGIEAIATAATSMKAAAHRGQVLSLGENITVLDDCYNSNPMAVEAAVAALGMSAKGRRLAFLGDMLELGPKGAELHRETGSKVASSLDALFGVGPLSMGTVAAARAGGVALTQHFMDSDAASAAAPGLVQPGDAVLVKGSRGIRMEKVVEALVARFGEQAR